MKIIECVPNFSEGRNASTLRALQDSLAGISGVRLLNLEPDADYNRVVVTLAGDEDGIVAGALRLSTTAAELIDMRQHRGEHPRLGAIDVVPFVPVRGVSMQECARLSERYAEAAAAMLQVPVYLYEEAARIPERKNLSDIRKGEYEGLAAKLADPAWVPDYGEPVFNERLGAIVTGARFFLVAYNVNIQSAELAFSKEIGELLRESGGPKRDASGQPVKIDGKTVKQPGRLKCVKGMGVSLEKYGITQVSMNLTNYTVTPIHVAFEEVKKEAARLGVTVNGSEIVGLVPLEALLEAGRYYAEGKYSDEQSLLQLAIDRLGLCSLNEFKPSEKIIDYMI